MSHGIKKETYVNADEKTTKALTFDLLNKLYEMAEERTKQHVEHLEICRTRFKKLESNKKKNVAIASASGAAGGFIAVASYYIDKLFNK